jgi:hypothetical protein
VKKDRKTARNRAAAVFREVSRKGSVTFRVANAKRRNTSRPYNGDKILDVFEEELPGYLESFTRAVDILGSSVGRRK